MGNCFLYKRGFGGGFGGGGGSTPEVEKTASGKGISILDGMEKPLKGLRLFGKTTQNGTPSPTAPVPLVSAGNGGSIIVTIGTSESDANPQTLTVSTPNGLPGIHVSEGGNYTDENGWQWVCDEVDFGRGVYVQRIGTKYLNGTENWVDRGSSKTARWLLGWNIGFEKYSGGIPRLLCDKYLPIDTNENWNRYNTLLSFGAVGGSLVIQNQSITSLEAFKATLAADPIVLQGVLATPIETALSAEQLAAYAALHTYSPSTTIFNDADSYMEVKYIAKGG